MLSLPAVLAACGTSSGGGGSGGAATLRFIGVADERTPMEQLTKLYAKGHDATIKTSYAPTDQVQTSVRTQLGAGNAPDLFVVYPGDGSAMAMTEIAKAGLLADLSDQHWTTTVPEAAKATIAQDGKTYMFSPGFAVIGAIYNKPAFAKAGVQPPTTWDELLAVCEKLKQAGITPISVGAQTPWVTQLITYAFVASTVYAENPKFDDQQLAGQASFSQSGWRQALEMYLELQKRGYLNKNPNGTTLEQQTAAVASGKAAMAVQVTPLLSAFRAAAAKPADIGMCVFPGGQTADKSWMWAGPVVGVGVSARSKNADAAKAFIDFAAQPANTKRWCDAVAAIPLNADASTKLDPELTPFAKLLSAGRSAPIGTRWPNAEVQPTHFAVVQDLLAGKTSVSGALSKMDKAYAKKA
jgi:raffinose/stachyose/melibiose transport system substrate-binding protein